MLYHWFSSCNSCWPLVIQYINLLSNPAYSQTTAKTSTSTAGNAGSRTSKRPWSWTWTGGTWTGGTCTGGTELVGLQLAGMLAPEQTLIVKQLERNTYSLNSYQKLIARYTPVSLHPYMLYATCYFFLYWWVCWVKLQSINPYTTCYQYTLTIRWLEPAITGYLYTITGWINQYTYYHWLLLVACSSPDTQYWLVSSLPLPRDSYWLLLLLITDCD